MPEQTNAGDFIKKQRLALNYRPDEVAAFVGLNLSSYYDLEGSEHGLSMQLSLREIAKLEKILRFDIRNLFTAIP